MRFFIKDSEPDLAGQYHIGGKAKNLFRLKEIFSNVPSFVVLPHELLAEHIETRRIDGAAETGTALSFGSPQKFVQEIAALFPEETLFAVRSSAVEEDGLEQSFAGQFASYLFVPKEKLVLAVLKVFSSYRQQRVAAYKDFHQLEKGGGMAIVIQEMVEATASGVGFGIDPVTGNRNCSVISAVYGLGEGLVSGELDGDTYHVENGNIIKQIAVKEHQLVFNRGDGFGLEKGAVAAENVSQPALSDAQIMEVAAVLDKCRQFYGRPQDIEFAFARGQLFLLQARPVTGLNKLADPNGEKVVWDNSNIIESYPGVTTPLTFSFISKSYEEAYKLFTAFMGVDKKVIDQHQNVFANTLGLINGRVYYNLKNWYVMLAMLPGYSINARSMEKMMGVKERFDIPKDLQLSKLVAWWRIAKMLFKMTGRFYALPRRRKAFQKLVDKTIAEYKAIDYDTKSANELMQLYRAFEYKLLNNWKAPLLNDFFAMIWFGLLEKRTKKYLQSENQNIHNDLLCGSSDIISVEPIHRSIALATEISGNAGLKELFLRNDSVIVWKLLQQKKFQAIKKKIDQYILDFGERCVGELKLETVSYTQKPALFIAVLQSYVQAGVTTALTNNKAETQIRKAAETIVENKLKGKGFKKWLLARTVNRTRDLVSNRENLRYERTRAFGIVRMIFSKLGEKFYAENIIDSSADIFYLTKDEIFSFIEGTSVQSDLKSLIGLRKKEFEKFRKGDPPPPRFASYGPVYHANDFKAAKEEVIEGDLKGIGCSPGKLRARVQVIFQPEGAPQLNGAILVTVSTDPGWVTLFPTAGGIIVERGSLLSHSAIVAREMGKPCIVGVTNLTRILKTGDLIEMDGSTGVIKIIENEG